MHGHRSAPLGATDRRGEDSMTTATAVPRVQGLHWATSAPVIESTFAAPSRRHSRRRPTRSTSQARDRGLRPAQNIGRRLVGGLRLRVSLCGPLGFRITLRPDVRTSAEAVLPVAFTNTPSRPIEGVGAAFTAR